MCDNYDSDNESYESISSVDEMPKPILEDNNNNHNNNQNQKEIV